jgi:sugar lactone lactonase YvrE
MVEEEMNIMSTTRVSQADVLQDNASRGVLEPRWRTAGSLATVLAVMATGAVACNSAPVPVTPTQITAFDAKQGSLPEGLAVRDGKAYVGMAPTGAVFEVDLKTGTFAPFSSLPKPVPNKGFMTGLAFGKDGKLYAALVSFVPEVQAGIYRVGSSGQPATLFAKHAKMAFPNGIASDSAGSLYVTDSAAGTVFRISTNGSIEPWATSDLLRGNKDYCGPGKGVGVPFDIGANGIAEKDGAIYVTNSDKALIAKIAIQSDGKAGEPQTFAGPDCAKLGGADGLTIDPDGNLITADNHLNKIVRVDGAGVITTVIENAPLDFPASLAYEGKTLYATNFAFLTASTDKARPGVIRIK